MGRAYLARERAIAPDPPECIVGRTRPIMQAEPFRHVEMAAARFATAIFEITYPELTRVSRDSRCRVEPGAFDMRIWAGDEAMQTGWFSVVPPAGRS
jgi:hypothetical protein